MSLVVLKSTVNLKFNYFKGRKCLFQANFDDYCTFQNDFQKPDDWLDDEPEFVPDPNGVKPDDWDEEEDGEWEAPQIGESLMIL